MTLNLLTKNIESNLSNPKVFRFKTNAQSFKINFTIKNQLTGNYPHLGFSAKKGINVLYRKLDDLDNENNSKEKTWYNVDSYTERFDSTVYMHHLVKPGEVYEVLIYGPILSDLATLEIENPDNTFIENIENYQDKKILIVGGLLSYGIGCTTSAITFSSIIGRKENALVEHLTFNNRNYLNDVRDYLEEVDFKEYDVILLEMDYVNQDNEITQKYLKDIIYILSMLCDNLICWYCIPNYKTDKKEYIKKVLADVDGMISVVDMSYLYDKEYSDIYTFSGNFINDSGNVEIYKKIDEKIRSL